MKRAYQVDLKVDFRWAVIAEDDEEAKEKAKKELERLIGNAPGGGVYCNIAGIKADVTAER